MSDSMYLYRSVSLPASSVSFHNISTSDPSTAGLVQVLYLSLIVFLMFQ